MQQKYIDLLDKLEDFFIDMESEYPDDDELESSIEVLESISHPPVFKLSDYKDLMKRIKTLEKKCKCKDK